MLRPEYNLQCLVVEYLRRCHSNAIFCASIAGHVHMTVQQWVRAKKSGYEKGFPDLVIYEPRGSFPGLVIEFKSEDGDTSPEQVAWLSSLALRHYRVEVVNNFETGVSVIDEYLAIKKQGE